MSGPERGAAGEGDLGWGAHVPPCPVPPEDLPDHDIHMDVCWKKVTNDVCSEPLRGHRTTYTECCCQDGEAWSQQCALCPPRSSGEGEQRGDLAGLGQAPGRGMPSPWKGDLERSSRAIRPCLPSLLFGDKVGQWRGGERIAARISQRVPVLACSQRQSQPGFSWQELELGSLSPSSLTEVYAQLCNVARIEAEREAGVHFRPGYEYGPGPDDLHYSIYGPDGAPFYNYLGPEDTVPEPAFPNTAGHPGDRTPILESPLQPSELQPHYVASHPGLCCCKNGEEVGAKAVSLPSPPRASHIASRVRTGKGKDIPSQRSPFTARSRQVHTPRSDPNNSHKLSQGHKKVQDAAPIPTNLQASCGD